MDNPKPRNKDTFMHRKVLFVATQDSHIQAFHLPFLKLFKGKGYEVHVATDTDKPIKYCDKKIKIPIKRSPFAFRDNMAAVRELRRIIDDEGYEIVHCHTPVGGVVARLASKGARKVGTRVIYTAHGFHFYKGAPAHFWMMFYPVEKWLAKYTDTIITINEEDYDRARRKFSRRCHDIQYVPGVGVDASRFSKKMSAKERAGYRKLLGLGESDKVLICNGRIDANKNQEFLVGVMKKLVAEDASYHLLLVGLDENSGRCQRLVNELGLQDNVHFLGFHKDIPELLQISDVVVSASKREGLPVSLIEAAMIGVPIVATDCRGNRDVCKASKQTIVAQGDEDGFIKALKNAHKGGASYDKKVCQAFVEKHGVKNVTEAMSKIYFKKKRILHILASNKYSGAENVACTIISNMPDFEMIYCSPRGPIEKVLKDRGVKYYGINKLNHGNLKKAVDDFAPDIIHAHDYRASLVASRFGKKCKIVSHIHLDNPKVRKISAWLLLYQMTVPKYKKIIWVSDAAFKNYRFSDRKNVASKSIVLRNVVDEKYIKSKVGEYRVDEQYDLAFVGRLSEQKNPERALEIVKLAKEEKKDIKMAMVGNGDKYDEIKKMIAEYGLEKNVKMYGFKDNPYPILNNSKILLMTSRFEGTPMVVLETLALGKPVVSVKIRGFEELVHSRKGSFLNDDNGILAREIVKILGRCDDDMSKKEINNDYNQNKMECYIRTIEDVYDILRIGGALT